MTMTSPETPQQNLCSRSLLQRLNSSCLRVIPEPHDFLHTDRSCAYTETCLHVLLCDLAFEISMHSGGTTTSPKFWRFDGSETQEAPIVATDVLVGAEAMSIFCSDALLVLGALMFFLATLGGLLLPSISVFGGVLGFRISVVEIVMILLPLFGNVFSFSSGAANLLGT